SEVWLARHPKTRELRVFKFASGAVRLKGLKREVTVSRFLRESLGERPELVRVLEWNFATHPYFLESEYGGPNFAEWAESQGGLAKIPLQVRLNLLADVARAEIGRASCRERVGGGGGVGAWGGSCVGGGGGLGSSNVYAR